MTSRTIAIRYFAILRERRRLDREEVVSSAETLRELYEELSSRHGFALSAGLVKFAVDGEFVPDSTLLRDGLEVALIPPVAGG